MLAGLSWMEIATATNHAGRSIELKGLGDVVSDVKAMVTK